MIARAKELSPDTEAVVLTGKSSLETAIAALQQGAFDYLTKPCKLVDLQALLTRVAEKRELTNKYRAVKQRLERLEGRLDLIGDRQTMQQVGRLIAKVAPTNSTVLILGETGTGKELVARAVHDQSLRADMPFVRDQLRGPAREPDRERTVRPPQRGLHRGRRASHGTVRSGRRRHAVSGRDRRIAQGACRPSCCGSWKAAKSAAWARTSRSPATCGWSCATHRDLEEMVEEGEFREDLMYPHQYL